MPERFIYLRKLRLIFTLKLCSVLIKCVFFNWADINNYWTSELQNAIDSWSVNRTKPSVAVESIEVPASPSQRLIVTLDCRWRWLSCPEHQLHLASGPQSQQQVWATCLVSPGARKSGSENHTANKSQEGDFPSCFCLSQKAGLRGEGKISLIQAPPTCLCPRALQIQKVLLPKWLSPSLSPEVLTNMLFKVCTAVSWDKRGCV